jgi:hypothetical protein
MVVAAVRFAPGAGETPDAVLEQARKLRAQKQPQAALKLLERLADKAPTALKNVLALELARTRVQLALQQGLQLRTGLFLKARNDLAPLAGDGDGLLETARIDVWLARTRAQQARLKTGLEAASIMAKADQHFADAVKGFSEAEKQLANPHDKSQARLEKGQALVEQAAVHAGKAAEAMRKRAALISGAAKVLESLLRDFKDDKDPALYLARAWLLRCARDGGEPKRFEKETRQFLAETRDDSPAAAGRRWARAFYLQSLPLTKAGITTVKQEVEDWLKTYAEHRDAPEGAVVRFKLASALAAEAQAIDKDALQPEAARLVEAAIKEFDAVAGLESDLADRAAEFALSLRGLRINDKTPLESLTDFDGCFLKGRLELAGLNELTTKLAKAKPEEREALEAQRKQQAAACVAVYERALRLAGPATALARLAEARYLLASCHAAHGELPKALEVSESLARAEPPTRWSADAAALALKVAAILLSRDKTPELRKKVSQLARFVLLERKAEWEAEPVTEVAHYQVALLEVADKHYYEAIDALERLSPDFPHYLYARCQLAYLLGMLRKTAANAADRYQFGQRALEVLKELPALPADADPELVALFFSAQIEHGNLLFETGADLLDAGQVPQAVKVFTLLIFRAGQWQQLAKSAGGLDKTAARKLTTALADVKVLGELGLAQAEYRTGDFDKVLRDTAAAVKDVLAKAGDDSVAEPIKVSDARLTGNLLGVALRAHVQKGNVAEARQLVLVLRRLTDDRGTEPVGPEVLSRIVHELKMQLRDQRKAGAKESLEATISRFSVFLEALGKVGDKGLLADRSFVQFLALCYASLDKHAEAAKLFAQVTEPKFDAKKKLTDADRAALQEYWAVQGEYGRSLRLSKQYTQARQVLERVLKAPLAPGKFQAEKELIHLLEDEGQFGRALTAWSDYLDNPVLLRAVTDSKTKLSERQYARELYFDGYYHFIWCHFKFGQTHKVEAKRKEYVARAAALIVGLETNKNRDGWELIGERLRALAAAEPALQAACEELRKKSP